MGEEKKVTENLRGDSVRLVPLPPSHANDQLRGCLTATSRVQMSRGSEFTKYQGRFLLCTLSPVHFLSFQTGDRWREETALPHFGTPIFRFTYIVTKKIT